MELKPVKSSNIAGIGYKDGTMRVQFSNGNIYEYQGVTEKDYRELMSADSIGSAFHFSIKSQYEGRKIEPDK